MKARALFGVARLILLLQWLLLRELLLYALQDSAHKDDHALAQYLALLESHRTKLNEIRSSLRL